MNPAESGFFHLAHSRSTRLVHSFQSQDLGGRQLPARGAGQVRGQSAHHSELPSVVIGLAADCADEQVVRVGLHARRRQELVDRGHA